MYSEGLSQCLITDKSRAEDKFSVFPSSDFDTDLQVVSQHFSGNHDIKGLTRVFELICAT